MIDIKEKDIVINNYVPLTEDSKELTTIHINFEGNKKGAEQLKQQILQDHEDAKKWEENMKLLSRNINDDLKQAKKDRQIVKRLEELDYKDIFYEEKVKEILEGKK
mgnify:CR=1 FL=1